MDQIVITSNATTSQATLGSLCCLALAALFPTKVSLPGTAGYNASQTSYFAAQQREILPACVVSPASTEDVSTIIKALVNPDLTTGSMSGAGSVSRGEGCPFAIRSGGHSSVPGSVNSDGGATLDLRALNTVRLNEDKNIVSLGVGARWGAVYTALEEHGLSVAGGRVASVGVGGLVLGGGLSYFSPRYGWACDSAVGFEIVLADGSIVHATEEEHRDLLVALRGGSGNFGVVTRIDMRVFEQRPFWGGLSVRDLSTVDEHVKFLDGFVSSEDEYASMIMSFAMAPGQGAFAFSATIYTKDEENPEVFAELDKLPSLQHTRRIDTMSAHAVEMGAFNPDGARQLWIQTTFKSSLSMINATYLHWKTSTERVESIASMTAWSLSFHPLPASIYRNSHSTGNALGFDAKDGPYMAALLSVSWMDSAVDQQVEETARGLMDAIEGEARKRGDYDAFVYLNYAHKTQDPLGGYGEESMKRLKEVGARVDPAGIFAGRASGFKLPPRE